MAECKRRKGALPPRFLALGDPPARGQANYVSVDTLWEEMEDSPLSDEVKGMVIDELIDAEQRKVGEEDLINLQGMYQHVDDG